MSLRDQMSRFGRYGSSGISRGRLWAELFFAIEELAPHVVEDLTSSTPEQWAKRWFDARPEAEGQARRTIEVWSSSPTTKESRKFGLIHAGFEGLIGPVARSFEYVGWNPQSESRAQARERIVAELTAHLDREMTNQDPEGAWRPVAKPKETVRDVRWFVLYQYGGQAAATIAAAEEPDPTESVRTVTPNQVDQAIRRLAKKFGIRQRTGNPPGRPPENR